MDQLHAPTQGATSAVEPPSLPALDAGTAEALGQASTFSAATLQQVVDYTAASVSLATRDGAEPPAALAAADAKAFHMALATTMSLAVREGGEDGAVLALEGLLRAAGASEVLVAAATGALQQHAAGWTAASASDALAGVARLVDVEWRLDLVRRSTGAGRIDRPAFVVRLVFEAAGGGLQSREVCCNQEQLRDLTSKLREAEDAAKLVAGISGKGRK